MTGDERPSEGQTSETAAPRAGEPAAGEARPTAPRYRPPAPYPPPAAYAPPSPPPPPANAVPGYVPPAGRVWAPPPAAAPTPPAPAGTAPPLHTLRPAPEPGWSWKQSLWGLLLGMGPFVALYAAASPLVSEADTSIEEVTVVTGMIMLVSSAISYGWQLFAAWLFSVRSLPHKLRSWGFTRPTAAFFWTIPTVLFAAYVVSYANDAAFNPPEQDIVEAFPPTAAGLVLFAVVAVVMAPLCEEIFFRGFVFKGFATSWGWLTGAVVSGTLFSLAHLQLTLFLPLFTLGFGLAWVYHRTGSLWTSIALHATFNGVAVLAWALTS